MDDPENKVSEDESCESERKDFSNPVYQELSRINGRINSMTKEQLITNLNKLQLDPNGNLTIMRKRLKNHIRMQKLASNNLTRVIKQFPFYVVIDFEATCEPYNPPDYPHEIIEFPAILVDSEKQTVIDEFHSFVKPVKYPKLSDFCIELTGITQETVDKSEEFPKVLNKFLKWLKKHGLDSKSKYAIVTDGPCDMGRFMLGQCNMCDIPYPYFAKNWINIRRVFSSHYKSKNKLSLASMLQSYGVEFDGRLHSGLDDSRNIANLLIHMIKDGVSVDINENIQANQMIDRRSRPNNKRKGSTTFKINQPRNYQQNQSQDQKVDVKIDQEDLDFAMGLMSVRNEVGGKLSDS